MNETSIWMGVILEVFMKEVAHVEAAEDAEEEEAE